MSLIYPPAKLDKLAILIDADNASKTTIKDIMLQIAVLGDARIKRIFGDLRNPQMAQWKEVAEEYGFIESHQTSYTKGKNAADIAIVIEAMKIMYTNKEITGLCIISSDSDFTPLIGTLKEHSIRVYGFGKDSTPTAFKRSCDIFFDVNTLSQINNVNTTPSKLNQKDKLNFESAIMSQSVDNNSWVQLGTVISHLSLIDNESQNLPKKYGYSSFKKLIDNNPDFFEVEQKQEDDKNPENITYYIRLNTKQKNTPPQPKKTIKNSADKVLTATVPAAITQKLGKKELETFRAIFTEHKEDNGYVYINKVNNLLKEAGITPQNYGFATIPKLIKANPQYFEVKMENSTYFFVKLK